MIATHRAPILAILVISSVWGCGGAQRTRPVSAPRAPGVEAATLRAAFKGRLETGEGRRRFEGTLALRAPDRLLVEIAGPLGGVRAVMAVKGSRVIVLFPGTREYIDEEAGAQACEALLGLRLEPRSLIDLIQFAAGTDCVEEPCVRRIPLVPGAGAAPHDLMVSRRDGAVSARLEAGAGDPEGFRGLELRLIQTESAGENGTFDELFELRIPAGWARLRIRPGGGPEPLLLPR